MRCIGFNHDLFYHSSPFWLICLFLSSGGWVIAPSDALFCHCLVFGFRFLLLSYACVFIALVGCLCSWFAIFPSGEYLAYPLCFFLRLICLFPSLYAIPSVSAASRATYDVHTIRTCAGFNFTACLRCDMLQLCVPWYDILQQ